MSETAVLQKNATYHTLDFSICTIVNDMEEYEIMKKTFVDKGFSDKCEYVIADNCNGNYFDAYQAISHFLKIAKGEFLIIVHQDVRAVDDRGVLNNCLKILNEKDKNWVLCGNAGGASYNEIIYHIDNRGIRKTEGLPKRVFSLDENFLVIKTEKQLSISNDIKGFHFYGTDLSIVADFLGYTCYVIPFMVKHLSKGNLKDLMLKKEAFLNAYGKKLRSRFIQTSCDKFYLGKSETQNKLYNSKFVFFWIKAKNNFLKLLKISQ